MYMYLYMSFLKSQMNVMIEPTYLSNHYILLLIINDEQLEETLIFFVILVTVKIFYLWDILYSKHNQS